MNNIIDALEDAIKASTLAPNYPQVNFNILYISPLNCDNSVLTYYNTFPQKFLAFDVILGRRTYVRVML